tara:strand:+ start:5544 stop:6344 length:801 start_codon:yes stop_codon:yes gene_type:complete
MARISTYSIDPVLNNLDKLHGSDENDVTRNFRLGPGGPGSNQPGGGTSITINNKNNSIVNYIIEADTRSLAFLFHNNGLHSSGTNFQGGTINASTNLNNFPFSSVTTLKVSKFPYATHINNPSPNGAEHILAEHLNLIVRWYDINNPNIYGIYKVTSFVQDSNNTDFFDMGLTYISGNGNLCCTPLPDLYIIEPWAQEGDKHFTHVQNSASSTWTVNHNLGKRPAVQAFTGDIPNGQQFEADIEHVNNNTLKIYLSADNSGYVYCN